jgi:hypothetical protein
VFRSLATNLDPADTNSVSDVYVRDLQTDTTTVVSRGSGVPGQLANAHSFAGALSSDGRYLAWLSQATNLSSDDPDGVVDVYVRDLQDNVTSLASRATPGYYRYRRPKGATPVLVSLVPAFVACTAPNRLHEGSLSFDSCSAPTRPTGNVTVGTGDANGAFPEMRGGARYDVCPVQGCAAPNVTMNASIADVRCGAALTCGTSNSAAGPDYTGELQASVAIRMTDQFNGVESREEATLGDFALRFPLSCVSTTSITEGGTCSASTTANAVVPGFATAGRKAINELGQVQVYDGGTDGDVDTPAGNALFAVQGIFLP